MNANPKGTTTRTTTRIVYLLHVRGKGYVSEGYPGGGRDRFTFIVTGFARKVNNATRYSRDEARTYAVNRMMWIGRASGATYQLVEPQRLTMRRFKITEIMEEA